MKHIKQFGSLRKPSIRFRWGGVLPVRELLGPPIFERHAMTPLTEAEAEWVSGFGEVKDWRKVRQSGRKDEKVEATSPLKKAKS